MAIQAIHLMGTPIKRSLVSVVVSGTVFLLFAGCARYSPSPVVESDVLAAYAERTLDNERFKAFAAQVSSSEAYTTLKLDPSDGLSLIEAEVIALYLSPELRAKRARLGIAEATAKTAGRWEDPTLSVEATRLIEGASSASNPWDSRIGIGLVIPVSGRLGIERKVARAEAAYAQKQYAFAERDHIQELRLLWLEYSEAVKTVNLLDSYLDDIEGIAKVAEELAAQGIIPRTDGRLLRIETLNRRAERQELAVRQQRLREQLLHAAGIPASSNVELQPTLESPDTPNTPHENLIQNHPRLQALREKLEASEQAFRLEVRRQYPDIALGPIGAEEDGFSRLGFGVSIPLAVWNRNARGVSESRANRDAARADYEAALIDVSVSFDQTQDAVLAMQQRLRFLREEMLPVVSTQIEETRKLAELGAVDVLLLREALSMHYETQKALVTAERKMAEQSWLLAGQLVPLPASTVFEEVADE